MTFKSDEEIDKILKGIEEVLENRINPEEMDLIKDLEREFNNELMRSIKRVVNYHRESQRLPYEKME